MSRLVSWMGVLLLGCITLATALTAVMTVTTAPARIAEDQVYLGQFQDTAEAVIDYRTRHGRSPDNNGIYDLQGGEDRFPYLSIG